MLVLAIVVYAVFGALVGLYGLAQAHLLWLAWRAPGEEEPAPCADADCPIVTVQLPVYNEPEVVEGLLRCVAALDWPRDRLDIQLLDDSTDDTPGIAQRVIAELDAPITHLQRSDRSGFKAGALAAGLAHARGNLVAIFDADFRPEPDFLRRMVPRMEEGVGLVQGRWSWLNRDQNLFTRLLALHLDAHFAVEQPARAHGDLVFGFNGTAGVWRRACIEDAGGWEGDTLTEDLDLAVRARMAGWRLRYAEDVAVASEIPAGIGGIRTQQFRWMKGGAQVARKLLGAVWRRERRAARLQAVAHLCGGALFAAVVGIALLAPVLVVAAAASDPRVGVVVGLASLPMQGTLLVLIGVYGTACVKRGGWRGLGRLLLTFPLFLPFSAALAIHNALAVLDGWRGRWSPFVRTPKGGTRARGPVSAVVWFEGALGIWVLAGALSPGVDGHAITTVFLGGQAAALLALVAASLGPARTAVTLASAGLALVGAEVGLRVLGEAPQRPLPPVFTVDPPGWIVADPTLGYAGVPGRWDVRFADGFSAGVTHGGDGFRVASLPTSQARGGPSAPVVQVAGGSFVHGLGLEDHQTLPWQLQERLDGWHVQSRAMSGWGPLQALLVLEQEIAAGTAPDVFVVGYAGFQAERVTAVRNWRRSLEAWGGGRTVPSTRSQEGTPRIVARLAEVGAWSLEHHSVIAARMSRVADRLDDALADSHAVATNVLTYLHHRGADAGVRVIVVNLSDDSYSQHTVWHVGQAGVETMDAGVEWGDPWWNLHPHDGHPNARANAHWAERIAGYLSEAEGSTDGG